MSNAPVDEIDKPSDQIVFLALWLLVFVIPMENIVVIDGIGTVSRLIGGVTFALGSLVVLWKRKNIALSLLSTTFALFLYWSLFTCLWSIDVDRSLRTVWSLFQLFVLVWLVWMFGRSSTRQLWLMISYLLGGYVASASTLWSYSAGEQATYLRYAAAGFDPNDLGLTLVLGVPMAWRIVSSKNHLFLRILAAGYIPVAILAILLTGSRAAFVALALAAGYMLVTSNNFTTLAKLALAGATPFVAWMIYEIIPRYSWTRFSSIAGEFASANLNSRVTIWRDGFETFSHQPMFGFGAGVFPIALEQYAGYAAASHNLFLSILVGQGIVGMSIFALMLTITLRQFFLMERDNKWLWMGMGIIWLAGVMTLSWELRKPTWLLLALITNQAAIDRRISEKNRMNIQS